MTTKTLTDKLDEAQAAGLLKGFYISRPGDGTKYVVWGHGIDRSYSARELRAFLESGENLWDFEYPEGKTRFRIGWTEGKGYFVALRSSSSDEAGRVSPYYRTRDGAVSAALTKEAEYAASES